MHLKLLPLAITTMLGPQILSAIILVTKEKSPIKTSLAYLFGVFFAASTGILLIYLTTIFLGGRIDLANSHRGEIGKFLDFFFIIILIFMSIRTYLRRKKIKPPKWLRVLQSAKPKEAFKIALILIYFMPTDILVMLTVGTYLASNGISYFGVMPYLALTMLIASMPLLFYLFFRKKAVKFMPKVRDWMNKKSWIVNIAVYIFFLLLISL